MIQQYTGDDNNVTLAEVEDDAYYILRILKIILCDRNQNIGDAGK